MFGSPASNPDLDRYEDMMDKEYKELGSAVVFKWTAELEHIIQDWKDGSGESLDGYEVEILTNLIRDKINFMEGNCTLSEYLHKEG